MAFAVLMAIIFEVESEMEGEGRHTQTRQITINLIHRIKKLSYNEEKHPF